MRKDEEVICEFMEPRPLDGNGERVEPADVFWWGYSYQVLPKPDGTGKEFHWQWHPKGLTLDLLHLVESRLTEEQRMDYWLNLSQGGPPQTGYWRIVHVTAEQKITALAKVLTGPTAAKGKRWP